MVSCWAGGLTRPAGKVGAVSGERSADAHARSRRRVSEVGSGRRARLGHADPRTFLPAQFCCPFFKNKISRRAANISLIGEEADGQKHEQDRQKKKKTEGIKKKDLFFCFLFG